MATSTAPRRDFHAARIAAALLMIVTLAGCASNRTEPPPEVAAAPPPPPPPPPTPPPVDLTGRWRFAAAGSGACFMNFGNAPGATQGTIAPEGGCPGDFYTSRKWTFERGVLIMRNHKGEPLGELSFANGRFEGQQAGGAKLSLSH
jgi:hypothetical protein